jgi:hypothetical protein
MRTMRVVAREVLAQHTGEMTGSGNEKVVEAFPAQGPDEALRDRVRPAAPEPACG